MITLALWGEKPPEDKVDNEMVYCAVKIHPSHPQ